MNLEMVMVCAEAGAGIKPGTSSPKTKLEQVWVFQPLATRVKPGCWRLQIRKEDMEVQRFDQGSEALEYPWIKPRGILLPKVPMGRTTKLTQEVKDSSISTTNSQQKIKTDS